jgi:hypothetical protein
MKIRNLITSTALAGLMVIVPCVIASEEEQAGSTGTVKGEVLDMACYTDHGASGAEHADCAKTCIKMGLPVGLKGEDGKTYLLIGDHKPLNKEFAQYAAKTITVKGKIVSRDGINMIENAEVVK